MSVSRVLASALLSLVVLVPACREAETPAEHPQEALKPTEALKPKEARRLPPEIASDAAAVVAANNAFAFEVYRALPQDTPNAVCSPFSMSAAFAMVQAGARGETEAEIARVFHFPEQARLHPAFHALLASLETGAGFGGYRLHIANRLWGQTGTDFLKDFLRVTREDYGAELARWDFAKDPEGGRAQVNRWVEERTKRRIQDLLPKGSVDQLTLLVLANAVYFKGTWDAPFDSTLTQDLPFHLTPTDSIQVPTMYRHGDFIMAQAPGLWILELPYRGGDLTMMILLPDRRDGLPDLERYFTMGNIDTWLRAKESAELEVYLPRFELSASYDLIKTLRAMGVLSAFDLRADFSGMTRDGGVWIGAADHQAFIKVNEEGTEAAAATVVVMTRLGTSTGPPPIFRADHPFLFLIRDTVTGSILFLGRVGRPGV